jgi:phosphoglycerate dehydrogenase-like enzyme
VWVPRSAIKVLGTPTGLEIAPIPDDPAADPRLAEVEMLVAPPRSPTFDLATQFGGVWSRMPSLRVVQVLTAGVDWIVGALPEGVTLCSARGAHDTPVAEWVLAAILAASKDLACFHEAQLSGRWDPHDVRELADAGVLILGFGSIGHAVERLLAPFGPSTVWRVARRARDGVLSAEALPRILPQADVVIVLLPLTPDTEGFVDERFIRLMRPGALLINAARGRLVDTGALLEALSERRIRAVLDVTEPEPLPPTHPLWRAPGLLITPHVAGGTPASMERAYGLVRDQLQRLARGEALINVVEGGY